MAWKSPRNPRAKAHYHQIYNAFSCAILAPLPAPLQKHFLCAPFEKIPSLCGPSWSTETQLQLCTHSEASACHRQEQITGWTPPPLTLESFSLHWNPSPFHALCSVPWISSTKELPGGNDLSHFWQMQTQKQYKHALQGSKPLPVVKERVNPSPFPVWQVLPGCCQQKPKGHYYSLPLTFNHTFLL